MNKLRLEKLQGTKFAQFTPREFQILEFIVEGLNNKEIADKIKRTDGTVKNHIFIMFQKCGCRDRLQMGIAAFRAGVVK